MSPGHKRLLIATTILGSGVAFLDSTVVNVALPAIRGDLGGGLSTQQWVVESYLLTLGSLLLVAGSLADRFGRRRVFAIGLAGFGATSLLCALAPSATTLVVARGLQGAAAALLVPGSLAILTATFEGEERGAAIGSWTAWTGIAFVIGPLAGGVLVDSGSWRLVFAINLPIVALTLWLASRYVPESTAPRRAPVDVAGAVLCAAGLGGVVLGFIERSSHSWAHVLVLVPVLAGLVLLAGFLAYERRASEPMLPLSLFARRNFSVANLATFSIYGGLGAAIFFTVLFLQQVAGYDALQAGLALMPITAVMFLLSSRFGALSERIGPRLLMGAGPMVAAAGLAWLSFAGRAPDYVLDLLPPVLLFGLGMAMTVAPLTNTVLSAVDDARAGIASGVNNAVARVAALVAIALVGAVVAAQFASSLDERLRGRPLDAAGRTAVAQAKDRALASSEGTGAIATAAAHASEAAFHVGIGVAAALVMAGGAISACWIRNPTRPRVAE